jgi:hypothetical protein
MNTALMIDGWKKLGTLKLQTSYLPLLRLIDRSQFELIINHRSRQPAILLFYLPFVGIVAYELSTKK